MKFTYTYRSSDGQRHAAEIEAESRDAAFAAIRREFGVRPIKVVALGGEGPQRDGRDKSGRKIVALAALVVFVSLAVAAGLWWRLAARSANAPYRVMTPQGPVTYAVADPLPRQRISGDRRRIEEAIGPGNGSPETDGAPAPEARAGRDGVFAFPAEAYLARFAEPGRPAKAKGEGDALQPSRLSRTSREERDEEFRKSLREPIRIASTDFTEVVDLKRIVTGMKLEMRAYLAGGGTVERYLAELERRQRLEISYRENAERRLAEMLEEAGRAAARPQGGASQAPADAESRPDPCQAAYSYWLKANAQLQAMGIYPLPLPDALRAYQMGLELEN